MKEPWIEPLDLFDSNPRSNVITVYHGSESVIKQPEFGKGKPYNDYGPGFYTTKNKGLAGEWAVLGTGRDGYINEYTLDMTGLKVLQLDKLPIENWIAILIANRRGTYKEEIVVSRIERFKDMFFPDVSSFDVIVGWRADDAYFSFVEDFMLSAITIENLQKAMKFGDLGQQVCCVSSMAFERLQFQNSYKAHVSRFYNGAVNRDETARKEYFRLARSKDASKGRLIFDIIGR